MRKLIICVISFLTLLPTAASAKPPRELKCDSRGDLTKMVAASSEAGIFQVDYVMWRESRCRQVAFNPYDPNGGSYGLFQINAYWCKPNRFFKNGVLQSWGVVKSCEDLFNPVVNALAFMAIFDYSERTYGDGWIPWGGKPWT